MGFKENIGKQLKPYSINDLVYTFITGDNACFTNSLYDESYELLDNCWDNKSGDDEFNTLLSYFIKLHNQQEIELKLYFAERKRYLDAIFLFEDVPILSDFQRELKSTDIEVYVAKSCATNWWHGMILLSDMRQIQFRATESKGKNKKYEIFQLENTPVGATDFSCPIRTRRILDIAFNKIDLEKLKTSHYW